MRKKSSRHHLLSVKVGCQSASWLWMHQVEMGCSRWDRRRGATRLSGGRIKINDMNAQASPILESAVLLAMDYGQFCLDGGLGDIDNELELLEQAQAEQPSAGDGTMIVVVCPHLNSQHWLIR